MTMRIEMMILIMVWINVMLLMMRSITLSVLISSSVSSTMGRLEGKEVMFKNEQSMMDSWWCLKIQRDGAGDYDAMITAVMMKMSAVEVKNNADDNEDKMITMTMTTL